MSQILMNSLDVLLDVYGDIVPVVSIFPAQNCGNPSGLNSFRHTFSIASRTCRCCSKGFVEPRMFKRVHCSRRRRWSSSKCHYRADCVSTCGGFQVVRVVLVWIFDSVGSSSVFSSSSPDASLSTFPFWHLSSGSIAKISTASFQIHVKPPIAASSALTATLDSAE